MIPEDSLNEENRRILIAVISSSLTILSKKAARLLPKRLICAVTQPINMVLPGFFNKTIEMSLIIIFIWNKRKIAKLLCEFKTVSLMTEETNDSVASLIANRLA